MRIAILFEYPTLWGGERSMLAAIDALADRQIEVVAIAPGGGDLAAALASRNIEHVTLQAFDETGTRRPREQVVPELAAAVRTIRPQLVHANSLSMSVLTGLLDDSVARVGHIRDIMKLSKNVIRLLNQNDRLIAVSNATRDHHIAQGLDEKKTCVLYNGVDHTRFCPRDDSGQIRKELGLNQSAQFALTVGQIGLRKGLDVLVQAIQNVATRIPELHFLIVGRRTSTKQESVQYEQRLRESLELSGLSHRVHWLGYRGDVAELMNQSTMLVHCANQEPLGRVLLEAAASGLPIIATDVGGTSEIVRDGISARLVPKGDHGAIANAIAELSGDAALRVQFSAAGLDHSKQHFAASAAAYRLSDVWTAVCEMQN